MQRAWIENRDEYVAICARWPSWMRYNAGVFPDLYDPKRINKMLAKGRLRGKRHVLGKRSCARFACRLFAQRKT